MMPKRIQRKRTKGWRMPEGAIYVGRGSRWGNPYQLVRMLGGWQVHGRGDMIQSGTGRPFTKQEAAAVAVNWYRNTIPFGSIRARDAEAELQGRDLACWCPLLDKHGQPVPCHADVLLEIANEPTR